MKDSHTAKPYSIGICVQYADALFTLAGIRFAPNRDVVAWRPVGTQRSLLNGTKHDPHTTYHGASGMHHHVAYGRHFQDVSCQKIEPSFSGRATLVGFPFGRYDAQAFGYECKGFDRCVVIPAEDIEDRFDMVKDLQGEAAKPLPTANVQIDLVEPGNLIAIQDPALKGHRFLHHELIKDTFPWCLVAVMAMS